MKFSARFAKLVFLFLSLTFSLHAFNHAHENSFGVQGYVLYFAPSYDETYFVINGSYPDGTGTPKPSGKRINNPVNHDLGFRLEGIYQYNKCFSTGLRWTHIHANGNKTVSNNETPPQLWPTQIVPSLPNVPQPYSGTSVSKINIMHQRGEFLFEQKLGRWFCCEFSLREAVEWSYIRYQEKVTYSAATTGEEIQFHGHTKGIGPQIGAIMVLEPERMLCWYPRNLTLRLMTTGTLLTANAKAKIKTNDALGGRIKLTQSSYWKLVREWTIDLSIRYTKPVCYGCLSLALGYEMTQYTRGTAKLLFDEADSPGQSFNQYSDFYVQGVYGSFGYTF